MDQHWLLAACLIVLRACVNQATSPLRCRSNVLTRHPTDCHKFQQCANGRFVVQICPGKLVFNPKAQRCDWPRNVPECNGQGEAGTSDCGEGGLPVYKRKHKEEFLIADCSSKVTCLDGTLKGVLYQCPDNARCDPDDQKGDKCVCNANFKETERNKWGILLGCKAIGCSFEGKAVKEGATFLLKNCSESYVCKNGHDSYAPYKCPANSHCENDNVCVCDEGYETESKQSNGLLGGCKKITKCRQGFNELRDYCVLFMRECLTIMDAHEKCLERGGRLFISKSLHQDAMAIKKLKHHKEGKYFIGGATEIDVRNAQSNVYIRTFMLKVIKELHVTRGKVSNAFKRFSGKATIGDWNFASSLSSYCLTLSALGPDLVKCNSKQSYICQQEDFDEEETFWTVWYSVRGPGKHGEQEDLSEILGKFNEEYTGRKGDRLCKRPISMEVREAGTNKMYTAEESHGYKLIWGNWMITCLKLQNGGRCPNFEVRYRCPEVKLDDCKINMVKSSCEAKGKVCKMRATGPKCIKEKAIKKPDDKLSVSRCYLSGIEYLMYECRATGDPHYRTMDGYGFDFMGECNYDFISVCNGYKPTDAFPTFNIVARNYRLTPKVYPSWTKSFSLTFGDNSYVFEQGKFYVNDIKVNAVGYSDASIRIHAKKNGDTTILMIKTTFCLTITWDNRYGLYVQVPDVYKKHVCGLCGNFDGNPANDLLKPGSNRKMTQPEMNKYFIVNGDLMDSACPSTLVEPIKCEKHKYNILVKPEFCGILDPTSQSPIIAAIRKGSNPQSLKANMLSMRLEFAECIKDLCWDAKTDRCHDMEAIVDKIHKSLSILTPQLDTDWRRYAHCVNTAETRCNEKPNMEYNRSFRSGCQNTCDEPEASADCDDENEESGCVCKKGFYMDAKTDCVTQEECRKSCPVQLPNGEKFILNDGEEYVEVPCKKILHCDKGNLNVERKPPCSIHADCVNNGRKCQCHEGYLGDGNTCETDNSCKNGYMAYGDKCYKLVRELQTWQEAAVACGAEGAVLARYDEEVNEELENFFKTLPKTDAEAMARTVTVYCEHGRVCSFKKGFIGLDLELNDPDKDGELCDNKFSLAEDKKSVVAEEGCKATFQVRIIEESRIQNANVFRLWIAGNSYIVRQDQRGEKPPFQIDPPRMLDMTPFNGARGCFQANLNKDGKLIITPNPNCDHKKPSICEYDNVGKVPHDPNNFVRVPELATFQEAIELCKKMNRPLVHIYLAKQQQLVFKMLKQLGGDGWLGSGYNAAKDAFLWSDGTPLTYTKWRRNEPNNYNNNPHSDQKCISMSKFNGQWFTDNCNVKNYPICGPSLDMETATYTPCYPVRGFNSVYELRRLLLRQGKSDFVCESPVNIECKAKRTDNGNWISNFNQQGLRAIVCTKNKIVCHPGEGADCSTFKARFMCPSAENQCHTLKEEGIEACVHRAGSSCIPVRNHYRCSCINRAVWNKEQKKCISPCGWCQGSGDPHFTSFTGFKFDQQGLCMYKFAGTCPLPEFKHSPNFDVFYKAITCGNRVSCINYIEVHLRNIEYMNQGIKRTGNFVFKVSRGTAIYYYNDNERKEGIFELQGVFKVIRKVNYFFIDVPTLGLQISFLHTVLKLNLPEAFANKMCGLCGDCGEKNKGIFKNKDLTDVVFPATLTWLERKTKMEKFALQWVVPFDGVDPAMCKVIPPPVVCTDFMKQGLMQPGMCGVFRNKRGPLRPCFDKIDPSSYYDDCMFDSCNADPKPSVCNSVAFYVQSCLERFHVIIEWRTDDFCPMDCKNKLYRVDASCEPTCGRAQTGDCTEDPSEGCVCPDGLMRQGEECVRPQDCGCKHVNEDGESMIIRPDKEMIIPPRCEEVAKCVLNPKDGSTKLVIKVIRQDPKAICENGKITCKRGYILQPDKSCKRDERECVEGFEKRDGVCVGIPITPKTWRGAIQVCNEKDGTLVLIDTKAFLGDITEIMKEKEFEQVFISGQVKAKADGKGIVTFKPLIRPSDRKKIEYYNYNYQIPTVLDIELDPKISVDSLKRRWTVLALVARLGPEGTASIVAVPRSTYTNFICEARRPTPPDEEWYGPCNSDSVMVGDGDQETKHKLKQMEHCRTCPVPSEIKCIPLPFQGKVKGECGITKNGHYYSCDQGKDCIDHAIKTKCSRDVDECAKRMHDCPPKSKCANTIGAYMCKCDKDYPIMIRGVCSKSTDCTMQGPRAVNEVLYRVKGFVKRPGVIPYTCPFKVFETCKGKYDPASGLPTLTLYAYTTKKKGKLIQLFGGVIGNPFTGFKKAFQINQKLLKQGKIAFGDNPKKLQNLALGFTVSQTRTTFSFVPPHTLSVSHFDSVFKFQLAFPINFRIILASKYAQMGCGMCTFGADLTNTQFYITMSDERYLTEDFFKTSGKCSDNIVPDPPTEPPTTPKPTTQPPPSTPRPTTQPPPSTPKPTTQPPPPTPKPTTQPPPVIPKPTTQPPPVTPEPTNPPSTTPSKVQDTTPGSETTPESTTVVPPPPPRTSPKPTTLPPPDTTVAPPPTIPPNECDEDIQNLCTALNQLCSFNKAVCEDQMCESTMDICAYLETADIGDCNAGQALDQFLDKLKCDPFCEGRNMEFAYTGGEAPEKCQPLEENNPENARGMNAFACRCVDGYKLSGEECVHQEDCGCDYEGSIYLKKGESIIDPTCSKRTICLGNDVKEVDNIRCNEHAACMDTPQGHMCKCEDGFFGDGYGINGCKPPEEEDKTKVCYTRPNYDSVLVRLCTCKKGYVSNCTTCVDYDECAENEHDCDLSQERCENTEGSYKCTCGVGFEPVNGLCKDIDECARGVARCGEREGCVNTPGSYECHCCAGFRFNVRAGSCEPDPGSEIDVVSTLPKCCVKCDHPDLCKQSEENPQPYCYHKAGAIKEFASYKALFQYYCVNNIMVDRAKVKQGACPAVIDLSTVAPPGGATQDPNTGGGGGGGGGIASTSAPDGGLPTTPEGETVTVPPPTPSYCDSPAFCFTIPLPSTNLLRGEVCGPAVLAKKKTFPSYCSMVRSVCHLVGGFQNLPKVPIAAFPGHCPTPAPTTTTTTTTTTTPEPPVTDAPVVTTPEEVKASSSAAPQPTTIPRQTTPRVTELPPPPEPTEWSVWSRCRVENAQQPCGLGKQSRYRSTIRDDGSTVKDEDSYEERVCFKPCDPTDPNFTKDLCEEGDGVCGEVEEHVCGSIGRGAATNYDNECQLNVAACMAGAKPYVVNKGECNQEPGQLCTAGPLEKRVRHEADFEGLHCIGQTKYIKVCSELMCKGGYDNCCIATGYNKIMANMECMDDEGRVLAKGKKAYVTVTGCKCSRDDNEEAGMDDMGA